jgi:hypothetical protein
MNKSINLSSRTIIGSSFWTIISKIISLSSTSLHIASIYILLLSSNSAPCLLLFLMQAADHIIKTCCIKSFSFINGLLLDFPASLMIVLFLLNVLIGNYAFFDLLVFVCHFLNVFSYLKDSAPESLVHLFVA